MKTRTLVLIPIFIFVVVAIFIFAACNNTEDGVLQPSINGFFTYGDTTYSLTSAIIRDSGANTGGGESGYNFDFLAASSGVDLTIFSGIGDVVLLDLNSPYSPLDSGTYTWSSTRTDYTLVRAVIGINYDLGLDTGPAVIAIGGTVTVKLDGSTIYTVDFTLAMADGKTVTGSYSGPAPVFKDMYID